MEAGVELISARHECNAASMADAYAKATQELTLVSVHSGPGLTNALTGIGEAAKSRTPLLVLAGDVPTGAVKSNFYVDQAEMVRSVGAVSERIHTPASAREDTLRAVVRALRDRQTVVLSLPTDVQDAPFAGKVAAAGAAAGARGRCIPIRRACAGWPMRLQRAERPLILAGRGAVLAGAEAALIALAERTGALLATSICGHGLFAGQPLVGRHQRRLRLAGGGRADLRERSHRRVRREPDALDHEAGQADRARRRGRASRRRGGASSATRCRSSIAVQADARVAAQAILAELDTRAASARARDGAATSYAQADRRRRQPQCALSGHVDRPASSIRAR